MSVELDWGRLLVDAALSAQLLGAINTALATASKPAFVGDLAATALDLGTDPPDVEVLAIGDIDTLFLDRTDRTRAAAYARSAASPDAPDVDDDDDEEEDALHDARRPPRRPRGPGPSSAPHHQHRLHERNARRRQHGGVDSNLGSPLGSGSVLGRGTHHGSGIRTPAGPGFWGPPAAAWQPQPAIIAAAMRAQALDREAARRRPAPPTRQPSVADVRTRMPAVFSGFPSPTDELDDPSRPPAPGNSATVAPSLQVHLRTRWKSSTVRCNIQTSLVINYPSPRFMSLDVSISLVGLVFDGVVILAIEGEKRKMHISIIEPEDEDEDQDGDEDELPDQEAMEQPHEPVPSTNGHPTLTPPPPRLGRSATSAAVAPSPATNGDISHSTTIESFSSPLPPAKPRPLLPPYPDQSPLATRRPPPPSEANAGTEPFPRRPPPPPLRSQSANAYMSSSTGGFFPPPPPPATPGARLLPSLAFESSVGEEDKHVLRNVGKVEKFVQDLVRKLVEDQLLFPNFKTVDLRRGQGKK